nr:MAG TPA: hypothetical protein [Caudoviricetes sp.]
MRSVTQHFFVLSCSPQFCGQVLPTFPNLLRK